MRRPSVLPDADPVVMALVAQYLPALDAYAAKRGWDKAKVKIVWVDAPTPAKEEVK